MREVDLVDELRLRLRQLRTNLTDQVLARAQHVLVLVYHLAVFDNSLTV